MQFHPDELEDVGGIIGVQTAAQGGNPDQSLKTIDDALPRELVAHDAQGNVVSTEIRVGVGALLVHG